MTVENTRNKSGPYNVTGTSGAFPRDFKVLDESHVRVIRVRGGIETDITTGVGHTGIGDASGSVVVSGGLAPGDQLYLLRAVPELQLSDYNDQGRVRPEQVESDFDLQAMMLQDLSERQSRALTLGVSAEISGEEALQAAIEAPIYATAAHEAAQAALASVQAAQDAAAAAGQAAADQVAGQVEAAQGAATTAGQAAAAAALSATAAAAAVEWSIPSIGSLRASTQSFPVGEILRTRSEGFAFEVIGATASADLTTAGGVSLRALPDAEGFVHIEQFGAIPDGNRLTGTGTDNTAAIRRAFRTQHHIIIGRGTYRVTQPIWNVVENRIVKGSGMGVLASSRETIRFFNPPSCILATDTATRRVITRRRYRASAADPNDAPLSAVIENWGGGTVYQNFSIELFCDYSNESQTNLGANWDIGFFNGCRGSTGLEYVSILGYFRRYGCLWDGTDAFSIPNHLDPEGNAILINGPSGFGYPAPGQPGGTTIRASGADHCWMKHCEVRGGRVGRGILGADRTRTGAPYYDYLTGQTYDDFRGGSGSSDFRSTDCSIFGPQHHSGYRLQNPIGWGSPLTVAGMDAETDLAPAAQHIDWWASNNTQGGPGNSARGMVFNDLRYVSWEMFVTRHGACHEVYYGPRVWTETGDGMYTVRDTSGTIITNTYDDVMRSYGVLATNDLTGVLRWENIATHNAFQRWVRDWRWTWIRDRAGREQGPRKRIVPIAADGTATVAFAETDGLLQIVGRRSNGVSLAAISGMVFVDADNSPRANVIASTADTVFQTIGSSAGMADVTAGSLGIQARTDGTVRFYNKHSSGDIELMLTLVAS